MLDVEMTAADGQPLKLKTGKQAALRFPIATGQQTGAPNTIPMWHFDEAKGVWKEEGTATKTGNAYEAHVSHFSTWNVDVPEKMATVKGKVTDACGNNAPVKNQTVYLGQIIARTDDEGNYIGRVPANRAFEIRIGGLLSDGRSITQNVPAISEGATSTQDVSFACAPGLEGRITLCSPATQLTHIQLTKDHRVVAMVYPDAQNRFKVFANQGETVTLTAFGPGDAIVSKTVVMPNNNTVTNLGDIELCAPVPLPATEFVLKNGTVETPYKLEGGVAQAVDNGTNTSCSITAGDVSLFLKIEGMATGVYQNVHVNLTINGKIYSSSTMQVTVTRYGAMGELVEGTFSGVMTPHPTTGGGNNVEIKNGKFVVRRILG